jgi:hypothetical protein
LERLDSQSSEQGSAVVIPSEEMREMNCNNPCATLGSSSMTLGL